MKKDGKKRPENHRNFVFERPPPPFKGMCCHTTLQPLLSLHHLCFCLHRQVDPEEMEDTYAEPRLPQNIDIHNTAEPATGDDLADHMIIHKTQ